MYTNRKLKAKIVENFVSQSNFAQVIRAHESRVSQVVRGRRSLKETEQKKWADILNCKPEEIFPAA